MNAKIIIQTLQKKYPGKTILKNDEKTPTEIICEIEPNKNHLDYSIALVVADKSIPHYHKKTTEEYKVIKGKLKVFKGKKSFVLKENQSIIIEPGVVHYVEGDETWFFTTSYPGWTLEDHIVI